jgi:hypothetical protein
MELHQRSHRSIVALIALSALLVEACVAGSPLQALVGAAESAQASPPVASAPAASSAPAAQPPAATPSSPAKPQTLGTVSGRVTSSPSCPVQTVPPNPSCADRGLAGAVVSATDGSGGEVIRTVSKTDGSYVLDLSPGRYTISAALAANQMMRAPEPASMTVEPGQSAELNFVFDSGIR